MTKNILETCAKKQVQNGLPGIELQLPSSYPFAASTFRSVTPAENSLENLVTSCMRFRLPNLFCFLTYSFHPHFLPNDTSRLTYYGICHE